MAADELTGKYDPTTSYNVYTPNKEYKGRVAKVDFAEGHAFLQGLPKSASEKQKREFSTKLAFLSDRGYKLERSKLAVRDD